MGNFNSAEERDQYGFNVITVQPQSPGQRAGLMADLDFVMTANGIPLRDMDKDEMQEFIASLEGQEVKLKVYHRERAQLRTVTIYPSRNWPGSGLLGISVKLAQYTNDSVIEKLPTGENRRCSVNLSYDDIFKSVDDGQTFQDEPASPISKEKKPMGVRIAHKLQKMASGRSNSTNLASRSLDSADLPAKSNSIGFLNSSSRDSSDETMSDSFCSNTHSSGNISGSDNAVYTRDSSNGARVQQETSPMRVMRAASADSTGIARSGSIRPSASRPLPSVPEANKSEASGSEGIAMKQELQLSPEHNPVGEECVAEAEPATTVNAALATA